MDRGAAEEVPVYENNQNTDGRNGQTDQVSPRRAVKSLQSASEQSGVAATELYDFDADSAAFSSASEAANKDGHEDVAYRDGLPAQRVARSASGVARVADALDFNTFTMETAAEDAKTTAAEYKKLDAEGVLREDRDTAEYLRNAATAALGHVQNAQAFGLMTVEEGYGYEQSLQSVIDGTQEYLLDNAMREGKAAENRKGGIGNAENLNNGTQRAEGVGADREGGAVPQGAAVAAKRRRNDSVEIRRAVGAGEFDQRSARSLGIENGSQAATMQVLREDVVDRIASLRSIREEAAKDGAKVVFFTGKCEVSTKRGRYQSVEGVYDAERNTFYIKADGISRDAQKVFRHEAWHKRVAENRAVLLDAAELLGKKYGTAELDRLVAQYCDAYYGIYGVIDASMSEDEATDIYMKYLEEICADAYAQIRRGGINIAKAEAAMETYRTDTQKQTAAATERTNGPNEDGTRYSIGEIIGDDQKDYGIGVHLDSTLLENLTSKERTEMVKERVKELGGEVFTAYDSAGNATDISIAKPEDRFKNRYGKSKPVNKDLTTKYIGNKTKQEAVVLLDELITTAKHLNSEASRYSHDWLDDDGKNNWDYWTTYVQDKKGTIWEATLNVANTANGEKILYDISPIKKVGQSVKSDTSLLSTGQPVKSGTSTVDASIAERETSVKQKYSLEDDTRELDAGYRRAVEKDAAENEPTGRDEGLLPEKKRGGTDYAELATEEIERRAKEATLSELRNMVKSTDTRLNQLRWGQRNGILTQELREQMKTVEETAKIQNEELRKRNKEERAAREQKKIEDAKKQVPRIAKKELKTELTELFHTAPGMRQTANDLIERTANRLLQQGYISSEDRAELRDKLFEAGVVDSPPRISRRLERKFWFSRPLWPVAGNLRQHRRLASV